MALGAMSSPSATLSSRLSLDDRAPLIQALRLGHIQRAQDGQPPGFQYLGAHLLPGHLSFNSLCWQYLVARREAVISPFVCLRDEGSRNRTAIRDLLIGLRKKKNGAVNGCAD